MYCYIYVCRSETTKISCLYKKGNNVLMAVDTIKLKVVTTWIFLCCVNPRKHPSTQQFMQKLNSLLIIRSVFSRAGEQESRSDSPGKKLEHNTQSCVKKIQGCFNPTLFIHPSFTTAVLLSTLLYITPGSVHIRSAGHSTKPSRKNPDWILGLAKMIF